MGTRTEIQGGPGGPWPPQKFSVVVAVNLCSFISISEYQIGTLFSYLYLVQFLPFISLGSPLGYIQTIKLVLHHTRAMRTSKARFTCKVNLYLRNKINVVLSQFEEPGIKLFPGEYSQTPSNFLARFTRRPVFPWPPQVKNCISVLAWGF